MVREQLAYLAPLLHAGLGSEMQRQFPEGSAFTHALYGLACCGAAARSHDPAYRAQAEMEAEWAFGRIDDAHERTHFDMTLTPTYGIFYRGWRNYLLARIVESEGDHVDSALYRRFVTDSEELAQAFEEARGPYLASYHEQAWPADNVVAMASLVMEERICHKDHRDLVARWIASVRERSRPLGSIPHAWSLATDRAMQEARGSSQALMNCFLPLIDSGLAADQYDRFRAHFITARLGVPGVLENADGAWVGDVDSGPVILGIGSAATIVAPGAARANHDVCTASAIDGSIDGLGFPIGRSRRYVFGAMPIADLFIVWTRTLGVPRSTSACEPHFTAFHNWSLALLLLIWWPSCFTLLRSLTKRTRERHDQYNAG